MSIRPLENRVIIKLLSADEKTAGGLIIPDSSKEKPMKGEVVAVGEGALNSNNERVAIPLKQGDIVVFGKWAGTEYKDEKGEALLFVNYTDVLGVEE